MIKTGSGKRAGRDRPEAGNLLRLERFPPRKSSWPWWDYGVSAQQTVGDLLEDQDQTLNSSRSYDWLKRRQLATGIVECLLFLRSFGAYRESESVECRNLTLETGDAFIINSESSAPESAFDGGQHPSCASACVTALKESMMTIDQNETCIPMNSFDSDPSIDDEINVLRARLEEPIRHSQEKTFSNLIELLMRRARREGNAAEQDRLITHGLAIQQQWLPMAVRDELLVEWQNALAPERLKFLRRYNLFAKNDIHLKSHVRWTQLWARYSKLMSLEHRIREWATMKNATVNPLLAIAKVDDAKTGQFGPLDEKLYQQLNDIYLHYEKLLREYHAELVCGLNMQGRWMDEWGYVEPGTEMDRADPSSESK